ncbi:glycosyltransferase family 2 protein [Sphingomonas humi]|uniref:Glycosyltransferase family 2 protein n=1 Tax=Sphingomonas humi TaxID=335630 RepID=A0ABP7RQ34_9SPHN
MMTVLALILLAPVLLSDLMFVAEVALGLPRGARTLWRRPLGTTAIILPAHNEEAVIARTLESLTQAAGPRFRVLVVADNCTDDTASIARGLGVEVIERQDAVNRGKGFALAFARDHLRQAPPTAVIVLDSDCSTSRDGLEALAGACQQLGRPVQAINLLEPSPTAGALVQVSTFAFLIKNLVRQRGLQRLAGSVHLTGTGMCIPWPMFEGADLATSSIIEDARLGLELARAGAHPRLVEECIVWSPHADQSHTLGQRSRWEGGFLALAKATAPGLIARGIATLSPRTLLAGLDLLVPPLTLLALVNAAVLALLLVLAAFGASPAPALLLAGVGLVAALVLLLAWWREGRTFLSLGALVRLPLYALWKIPMYLKLVRSGAPKQWNRTERPQ